MARSENRLARGSPLPSSAQRSKTGDLSPNNQLERNAHPAYLKARESADPSINLSDDRKVRVHSSGKSPVSKDARPPLHAPHGSNSPESNVQACAQSDRISRDLLVHDDCLNSGLSQPLDLPISNDSSNIVVNSSPKNANMERMHAMPVYRKMSRDHSSSASSALPRASFDNAGLGISSSNDRDGHRNDQPVNGAMAQSCTHHRSASGTSELSTASCSSLNKQISHYVHPMRQAPRTYTPPLNQSYQASIAESNTSANEDHVEEDLVAHRGQATQSMRGLSVQTPRLSLQTQEDPFTKLHGTSQTNLTGRRSFGYSRETGSVLDTASPISRSSLDFSFRSRTRTSMDPISRAATVQAARQAFEEKEAAKARKLEEQQLKAEAREMRRKEKQPWRVSLKQDEYRQQTWQKEHSEVHGIPAPRPTSQPQPASETWKPQPKNTWMHFLTWLRTRLFKIKRKVNEIS